jgi:hypothetical protein
MDIVAVQRMYYNQIYNFSWLVGFQNHTQRLAEAKLRITPLTDVSEGSFGTLYLFRSIKLMDTMI